MSLRQRPDLRHVPHVHARVRGALAERAVGHERLLGELSLLPVGVVHQLGHANGSPDQHHSLELTRNVVAERRRGLGEVDVVADRVPD